jgi:outer membrane protein assembly factor BamB
MVGTSIESTSRPAQAAIVALLVAVAACGGGAVQTDPLASIADAVREEDRSPPPLAEAWRRAPATPLTLPPAVGDDSVYLALDNRLVAWSAFDGAERWAPIDLDSPISAPPVALGGEVLVASRGGVAPPGGTPRLWRFAADGSLLAQTPLQAPIRELSAGDGGTVVFVDGTGAGRLAGGEAWHTPVENAATVVLAEQLGLVLVTTSDGTLLALDARTGTIRWQRQMGSHVSRPRAGDQRVYVGAGDAGVFALRAGSGEIEWHRRLGTAVIGAPALAQDLLWVGAFDAKLHALKASNGTEMETLLVDLSARNYLDIASFEPWVVVGAAYGPWVAVRGPTRAERRGLPVQVVVRQPAIEGRSDLALPAGSGPAGVAVVNWDGVVVFLQPQRPR